MCCSRLVNLKTGLCFTKRNLLVFPMYAPSSPTPKSLLILLLEKTPLHHFPNFEFQKDFESE